MHSQKKKKEVHIALLGDHVSMIFFFLCVQWLLSKLTVLLFFLYKPIFIVRKKYCYIVYSGLIRFLKVKTPIKSVKSMVVAV